ncbi:glutamine amidotransferase [Salimicrobium jeotgali]|uniref:Glutamine amidotransferase n=1 Tax=Salimicrobium jeotgali TaxID=1230341 RepID=K2FJ37_9BACI|nr:type 1 glutamine amidotransferase domain-containing protein [Salimicrobium jeotgali]AKG05453.1 glutamine amidotransferase [Salimicrobium jeotgali]EKE31081.1 ThiJ/PfpI domain-containing protein [Salimicrobium jeotgali]MBM7697361.1 putative intracellular protease/amidase [Salimicrobium jeotgali]
MSKKVLMIVTNHDKINEETPTGIWLSEFAEAYNEFKQHGFDVTVASPSGGQSPVDPNSVSDDEPQENLDAKPMLENTTPISSLNAEDFDAVFLPGGHGTMFDFPDNEKLQSMLRETYESKKPLAAVCHGPAALVNVKLSDGQYIVQGKSVNAFTDAEEADTTLDQHMPFLLESKLRERGAHFLSAPNWSEHVETDGNLITGQNPQSTVAVAKEFVRTLQK